jgi:hypothetical protein
MYQTLRSVSDNHVFVVCRDGTFYERVPEEVREQGAWQGQHRGDVDKLKPEYRLALERSGYALVGCEAAVCLVAAFPELVRTWLGSKFLPAVDSARAF